jgi:MoaA/NifB/PqqE/SkfB family radical SAM enzyme
VAYPVDTYDNSFNFITNNSLNEIREAMLRGERPDVCSFCWNLEDKNRISSRQRANNDYKTRELKLTSYDLRNDDTCNLSCRMCNPMNSTTKQKEWNALERGYFKSNSIATLDIINIDTVEHLYMAGGEPFLNPELETFLDKCIQQDRLHVKLQFNTNCSTNSKNLITKLKLFDNIHIIASCDGYGEMFEYIRYPHKWNKFVKNLEIYKEFSKSICFNVTIMNYNIDSLHVLINWIEENYKDSIILLNILDKPKIYQFTNLPVNNNTLENVRKLTNTNAYKDITFKTHVDYIIKSLIEYEVNRELYNEFLLEDSILNKHRNIGSILK